jgi:hypothetical protein
MIELIQKAILYGFIGLLIEVWFTGISSLFSKHWKATGATYLWMFPVYALTGLCLEAVSDNIAAPFYIKAFIYLPVIYGAEALSGGVIMLVTLYLQKWLGGSGGGVIPWHYGKSWWTPFGLVNFKYLPFWFALAMGFDTIASYTRKAIAAIAG